VGKKNIIEFQPSGASDGLFPNEMQGQVQSGFSLFVPMDDATGASNVVRSASQPAFFNANCC